MQMRTKRFKPYNKPKQLDYGKSGPDVYLEPNKANHNIINNNHAIFAVLSNEIYLNKKRKNIDGWQLVQNGDQFCWYQKYDEAIMVCRGTTASISDFRNDYNISQGQHFERAEIAKNLYLKFKNQNQNIKTIYATGHSLGGAVARTVSEKFGIQSIVFNPAAPPTAPIEQPFNCYTYHIVMDTISAWEGGGQVIRLNQADIIIKSPYFLKQITQLNPTLALAGVLAELNSVKDTHSISRFFEPGEMYPAQFENNQWQEWWNSHPFPTRKYLNAFLWSSGITQHINWSLPPIPGTINNQQKIIPTIPPPEVPKDTPPPDTIPNAPAPTSGMGTGEGKKRPLNENQVKVLDTLSLINWINSLPFLETIKNGFIWFIEAIATQIATNAVFGAIAYCINALLLYFFGIPAAVTAGGLSLAVYAISVAYRLYQGESVKNLVIEAAISFFISWLSSSLEGYLGDWLKTYSPDTGTTIDFETYPLPDIQLDVIPDFVPPTSYQTNMDRKPNFTNTFAFGESRKHRVEHHHKFFVSNSFVF